MKKCLGITAAIIITLMFTVGAFAEPSAKVTANVGAIKAVTPANGWTTIMKNTIKTAQTKDLFVDVSLECGLTTNTMVMSSRLIRAIATAEALVKVQVKVDGNLMLPGEVIFERRKQTLIAEFAGDISQCIDAEGHVIITDECVQDEMLALILETMSANSFNFIAADVPVGTHTITVEAKVEYSADNQITGFPATNAYLGKGSVTVESVRMIKDESVIPEI